MQKYWLTIQVPVEAESANDALDMGWERVIDPDGPPEGLVETVSLERPETPVCLAQTELDSKIDQIVKDADKAQEAA